MTIALTAPTGHIGTKVLAAATTPIRPLGRKTAVRFDFGDPSTFAAAFDGVRTLVFISPPEKGQTARDNAVVDAAKAAGVTHIVRLSGFHANEATTRFMAHHDAVERHIRASGIAWTFVRPTFFMENLLALSQAIAAGRYPAPTADAPMSQVAVADIAAVILAVANAPEKHRGATYELTGPSADRGSAIAATLAEATGHAVDFVDVPEDAFRANMLGHGMDPWSVEGIVEAFRKVRAGDATEITGDVQRVLGRAPIAFPDWARANLRASR